MIKWFAYIVMLLIFVPHLSSAGKIKTARYTFAFPDNKLLHEMPADSLSKKLKQQQEEEKKKIKEISKAKRQAKPEKIDEPGTEQEVPVPVKPKRQRRPEGMERPPEIPRRNEN